MGSCTVDPTDPSWPAHTSTLDPDPSPSALEAFMEIFLQAAALPSPSPSTHCHSSPTPLLAEHGLYLTGRDPKWVFEATQLILHQKL